MEYAVDPVAVATLAGRWEAVSAAVLVARARVPGEAEGALRDFVTALEASLSLGADAAAEAAGTLAVAAEGYAAADATATAGAGPVSP